MGDDAAVMSRPGLKTAVSVDSFTEGTHFNELVPPDSVGYRSAAGAASDIFAMGAHPEYILVALGLKDETADKYIDGIYEGIADFCMRRKVKVAGGDIVRSRALFLCISAIGFAKKFVTRWGARAGDAVFITDYPGLSAAGLELLSAGRRGGRLVKKFLYPDIYRGAIEDLAPFVNSLIDSSDGLVSCLRLIAAASGVRINLESGRIPLSSSLLKFCKSRESALKMALSGGEDYYLAGTSSPDKFVRIKAKVFEIGKVVKGEGVFVDGRRTSFMGFRHFGKRDFKHFDFVRVRND